MKYDENDIKKIEEILKVKPKIKVPEFNSEFYFNKQNEPTFLPQKTFYFEDFIKIAASFISGFIIVFLFYQQKFNFETTLWQSQNLTSVKSKDIIGVVLFIKGKVDLISEDKNQDVYQGTTITENSTIKTYDKSTIEIVLDKRIQIRIKENTTITLTKSENLWKIFQEQGISYHNVKSLKPKENYYVETPSAIAGVRGTFFYVNNNSDKTEIEVHKGNVIIYTKELESGYIQLKNKGSLTPNNLFLFDKKIKKIEKKVAKKSDLDVLFKEMEENFSIIESEELWENLSKIPTTTNKNDIEKVYNKRVEKIHLVDGRILEGVIASQVGNKIILHTTTGIFIVNLEDIKEITFE